MTLPNLRAILSYQAAPTDRREPVFGTDYSIRQITLKHYLVPKLRLPPKNMFVLNSTELENAIRPLMNISNVPQPITDHSDTGGWFLPQRSLKSIVFLSISLGRHPSLDQFAMLNLITRIKIESMDDIAFQLAMAQYQYAIEIVDGRLEFSVWGFQHKLEVVLQRLISSMKDPKISEMNFAIFKDSETRRFENLLLEKPSKQAFDKLQYTLGSIEWTNQDLIYATKDIQHQELKKYASELIKEGSVLFYIQGNLKLEEAARIYHHTKQQLNLSEVHHHVNQATQLPSFFTRGSSFCYRFRLTNRNETNSGIAFYLHTFNEKANKSESLTRMALYFLKKTFDENIRFYEQIGWFSHHTTRN
ncbi:hypothetical protein DSO57_1010666 [Entomophthora muscae]|uniref:Uncharacterized protein n=1 Tax=Entomophthora muscae TaxID=34485 RepID=A0ACC2RXK5_9FUNG|nr:hypothetical protein DSO57_1010666 [Entomophthora muscae]